MKKKKGSMVAWVKRLDSYRNSILNDYLIFCSNESFENHDCDYEACPKEFEKHFFKLKPGAGPVPVDITIKRRKK